MGRRERVLYIIGLAPYSTMVAVKEVGGERRGERSSVHGGNDSQGKTMDMILYLEGPVNASNGLKQLLRPLRQEVLVYPPARFTTSRRKIATTRMKLS